MGWRRGHKPAHDGDSSHAQASVWHVDCDGRWTQQGNEDSTEIVELFAIPFRKHTGRGDIVFEPFSGSGSQIIAAERESRAGDRAALR